MDQRREPEVSKAEKPSEIRLVLGKNFRRLLEGLPQLASETRYEIEFPKSMRSTRKSVAKGRTRSPRNQPE